jgi:hypothetical protein
VSKIFREFVLSKRVLTVRFRKNSVCCKKCDGELHVGDRVVSRVIDCTYCNGARKIYHAKCWEACFV